MFSLGNRTLYKHIKTIDMRLFFIVAFIGFLNLWVGDANEASANDISIFYDSGQRLGNSSSNDVALGDLDGDGDLDAFVANGGSVPNDQPNKVWLNDGFGVFSDSGQSLGNANSWGVALGDLDGDGDLDAFVANASSTISLANKVWLNDGTGVFSDSGQELGGGRSLDVALGDLDGDGDLDALVGNGGGPNFAWLNDGGGLFNAHCQWIGSGGKSSYGVALGELNGSGGLDIYLANRRTSDEVLFRAGISGEPGDGEECVDIYSLVQMLGSSDSNSVALGDVDSDGDLDAFVANDSGQPDLLWLNDGTGTYIDSGQRLGNLTTEDVSLGDVDGDGDLDALATNRVWLNNGTGTYTDSGQILPGGQGVALGDLDGDDDLDAFFASFIGPNMVWLNGVSPPPNFPPLADPNGPYSGFEGSQIAFDGTGSTDPDNDPLTYAWNFDDGNSSAGATPSHTYDDNGTYNVCLTVDDGNGASDNQCTTATIANVAPTATFNAPGTVDEGDDIILSMTNPGDPSGADTAAGFEYAFDCGDGAGYSTFGPGNTAACPTSDNEERTVKGKIRDKDGGITEYNAAVTVENLPPDIASVNNTGPISEGSSATIVVDVSDSAGINDPLEYKFDCNNDSVYEVGPQPGNMTACIFDDNGSHTVNVQVSDGDGGASTGSTVVSVNNVAPTATFIAPLSVDEGGDFNLSLTDPSDPSTADTIAGFEYAFNCGEGYDAFSATSSIVCPANDSGTVVVKGKIRDKDGGETEYTASVTVINVAPVVGPITAPADPVEVGTPIAVSAVFADVGILDTHTAVWDWGDNNTSIGTVIEANGSGSVSGSHIYAEPGVYAINLTVTDDDGGQGESVYQYVVAYDSSQTRGFVTGAGHITSPTGAYLSDPNLFGMAQFGFVSRYQKGATIPEGHTHFRFKVADLEFRSTQYEWLVVAGHKAMFKGVGTINGDGNYGFLISAIDEKLTPSTDVDLFRIKIWDKDNGDVVVYDNSLGAAEYAEPTTAIGGGNIVIHNR